MGVFSKLFLPPKLRLFHRKRKNFSFSLLDVGCGNHSPSIVKRWYPKCLYFGLDREAYNVDAADQAAMDEFYSVDLVRDGLYAVTGRYDVILASHVLEHLSNGLEILAGLCDRLNPGGDIYIELPAPKTVHFPHGRRCLNFYDDPTHCVPYPLAQLMSVMEENNVIPERYGTRRDPIRLAFTPLCLMVEAYSLLRYRQLDGPTLYDLLGFANFIYGVKPAEGNTCLHPEIRHKPGQEKMSA